MFDQVMPPLFLLCLIWPLIPTLAQTETFRWNTGHSATKKGNRSLALAHQHHQTPTSSFCSSPTPVWGGSLVFLSPNMGSQGKCEAVLRGGRCSFWTHQTQGSTQGPHSCREATPPSFSLPLNAGVTVPALNTSSWPQSGRHVAAGLRKTQVFYRMI